MHLLRTSAALAAIGLGALAQDGPMLEISGVSPNDNFGFACAALGDVDGDGVGEYAVGAYLHAEARGQVRLFSGQSGAPFFNRVGDAVNDQLGYSVANAGDVDGDGADDVLAGAYPGGYARVFSGATGAVLLQLSGAGGAEDFGYAVASAGDVDGDGVPDLAVGAPRNDAAADDAGAVYVFSGVDGSTIRVLLGGGPGIELGFALAKAGLVDADNVPDLIAGTANGSNQARVHSGATGALIHQFAGDNVLDWFGTAVACAGDVDRDGRDDLAVGASQALLARGYVRFYSGATGAVLRTIPGQNALDLFGWSVACAGDYDGDGFPDAIVGAPLGEGPMGEANVGRALLYSGKDGSLLKTFYGIETDGLLGWSVDAGPCRNVIAGAPSAAMAGQAKVYDTNQAPGWSNYCVAAPNSAGPGATISASGTTSVAANDLVLFTVNLPPNTFGLYFYGQTATQVPFGDGFRCIGSPFFRRPAVPTRGVGVAIFPFDLGALSPAGQVRAGEVWRFQLWYRDVPAGGALFNFSDGLRVLFCP